MQLKTHISVVIVSYNVCELLLSCLHSLKRFENPGITSEIIVVDNLSSDDTIKAIQSQFPEVILIANQENAGFPKANNQGFARASGDYIFMLNPDTELIEDTLTKLYAYLEENKAVSIVAPRLLNTDRSWQSSIWKYPSLWTVFCETHYLQTLLKKRNYLDSDLNAIFPVESVSGAAIFFRKEVLDQIGNLDETMFWIEDVDFCYRANQAGLTCMYYPKTELIHHVGQSAKKNYNISISNQVVNKIKFFRKHYSRLQTFMVVLLSFYHVLLKLFIFTLLAPFKKVYYRKAKAYWFTLPRVFNPPKGIC